MMDLTEKCHHCGAEIGEWCSRDCSVNGKKIIALETALQAVGKNLTDIKGYKEAYNGKNDK